MTMRQGPISPISSSFSSCTGRKKEEDEGNRHSRSEGRNLVQPAYDQHDQPVIVLADLALSAYQELLASVRVSQQSIGDKLEAIRKQHVTNLFYVPAGSGLEADHIVLLDDVHTMPAPLALRPCGGAKQEGGEWWYLKRAGLW